MTPPLASKIAFISGVSRGIGRAIALKLAGAGCDVALVYYTGQDEAESACAAVQALGRRAVALPADVGDPGSVAVAFRVFRETFDRVDILVNNAATGVLRPTLELTLKHWRRCLETNALALQRRHHDPRPTTIERMLEISARPG